jgi:transposase-like protein
MLSNCRKAKSRQIAREYGIARETLHNRIRKGRRAKSTIKPVNRTLDRYQDEALIQWIVFMNN